METRRYWMPLVAVLVLLWTLLFFRDVIPPGRVLFHTDDSVGINAAIKGHLPGAFLGFWNDAVLLGTKDIFAPTLKNALLFLLSPDRFTDWIHAICVAGASFFLLLYFRARGLSWPAGFVGVLASFWLASNFTLIYPGHLGKFDILLLSALFLWCMSRAAVGRSGWLWAMLAGGVLGQMFVEQQDVALFFACVLGPYALFTVWNEHGWDWKAGARAIVPLLLVAALFAAPAAWVGYNAAVRGIAAMERETPSEKWGYCTQWSWPPEECLDFIAPGYMGWRSGEPEGPYWGRMGRSPGWEQTRQGFQNFKLENQYLGAIPLALAVFAALAALMGYVREYGSRGVWEYGSRGVWEYGSRGVWEYGSNGVGECRSKENHPNAAAPIHPHAHTPTRQYVPTSIRPTARAEIIFWSVAALVTLLLAFGKYFPLYGLFYQLPLVSSIRNPNKFLQVFQLAAGILAAYGFELALTRRAVNREQTD